MLVLSVLLGAVFAGSPARAREVDWRSELATDAALGLGTMASNRFGPHRGRYVGNEFPTQGFDDKAHRRLHGEPTAPQTTAKERRYRELSNVTVVAAGALPAAMALWQNDEATAGRLMTTSHALFLGGFVGALIKHEVGRPRPKARQNAEVVAQNDDASSFPSGHATAAFTGATLVACFFPESPWWVRGAGFGLATATALFRIEGDKHFLTDVTAGALLGVSTAVVTNAYYEKPAPGWSVHPGWNSLTLVYEY